MSVHEETKVPVGTEVEAIFSVLPNTQTDIENVLAALRRLFRSHYALDGMTLKVNGKEVL